MTSEGFLLAVAQIAVALAGFSGLVVATRGASPAGWSTRDTWSLAGMFGASIGALFLALLPSLLFFLGLPTEVVWMLASLLMAAFLVAFSLTMGWFCRKLSRSGQPPRVRYFSTAATLLLLVCGCLAGLGALGIFGRAVTGVFILGLMACLLVSALALVVFLMIFARTAKRAFVNSRRPSAAVDSAIASWRQ
jgi:hypothetical protein